MIQGLTIQIGQYMTLNHGWTVMEGLKIMVIQSCQTWIGLGFIELKETVGP